MMKNSIKLFYYSGMSVAVFLFFSLGVFFVCFFKEEGYWFTYPPFPSHTLFILSHFNCRVQAKKEIRKKLCEKDSHRLFMRILALWWHVVFFFSSDSNYRDSAFWSLTSFCCWFFIFNSYVIIFSPWTKKIELIFPAESRMRCCSPKKKGQRLN